MLRGRALPNVQLLAKDQAALHEHFFLDKRDSERIAILSRRWRRFDNRADQYPLHDDVLAAQDLLDGGQDTDNDGRVVQPRHKPGDVDGDKQPKK